MGLVDLDLPNEPERTGGVAVVTLNNPPLNLVTGALLRALYGSLATIADADVRVAVVTQGESRAFSAGSDLREFDWVAEAAAERKVLFENHVLRTLSKLSVPTIAAIEGAALGGGLELALACDLRIAGSSAKLGLPEAAVGGLASNGSQRLTKIVGPTRAKYMLLTGDPLTAAQAESWGLLNQVVADGCAFRRATEVARNIADKAPLSVRLAKKLVDDAVDVGLDAGIAKGIVAQERIFASQDLMEGASAFFEGRTPRFQGG
jgi:enoyl-CoA hydratase